MPNVMLMVLIFACNYLLEAFLFSIVAEKIGWGKTVAWIPIAQYSIVFKAIGWSPFSIFLMLIPIANIVIGIVVLVKFLRAFGLSGAWAFMLFLLNIGALVIGILLLVRILSEQNNYVGPLPRPADYSPQKVRNYRLIIIILFVLNVVLAGINTVDSFNTMMRDFSSPNFNGQIA